MEPDDAYDFEHWPEYGQKLFVEPSEDVPFRLKFCVNYGSYSTPAWNESMNYAEGYCQAAVILMRELLADETNTSDKIGYPLFFLHRHAVELAMKKLIGDISRCQGNQQDYPNTHSLLGLWKILKDLMASMALGPDSDLDNIRDLLEQVDQIDPAGAAFRFPETTKRQHPLPNHRFIDVQNFHSVMMGLHKLFGEWDFQVLCREDPDILRLGTCSSA